MKQVFALLTCAAFIAPALAQDSNKEMFKKAEKGAGQLFQGMGQEIRKARESMSKGGKKADRKPEANKEEKK